MAESIKDLLVAELKALKERVQKSAGDAEKKMLDTQYGQRIEHLAKRIEDFGRNEGVLPDAKAKDPEAGE